MTKLTATEVLEVLADALEVRAESDDVERAEAKEAFDAAEAIRVLSGRFARPLSELGDVLSPTRASNFVPRRCSACGGSLESDPSDASIFYCPECGRGVTR